MSCYGALALGLGLLAIPVSAEEKKASRGGGHPAAAPKVQAQRPAQARPVQTQGQAGRAGTPNNQPAEQLENLLKMKPEERDNFLKGLSPQRQENLRRRIDEIEKMTPARRTRVLTRLDMLASLPPQKQQQVRRSMQQFQALPEDRRTTIGKELQQMAPMPDEQRGERMNSEEFRNRYSVTEQQMIRNLSEVTPEPQF